jgi:PIN domain nuclease of toxin-antitoxin system
MDFDDDYHYKNEKEQDDYKQEDEEEKFDLTNLLNFLSTKGFNCNHIFACENRVVFLLIETKLTYLLIYIPSKYAIMINHKSMTKYIPTTNIKVDDDEKLDSKNDQMKRNLEKNLKMFLSNPIKMSYICKDIIIFMNRHNEVEHLSFETYVPFENIYWVIDLENFNQKINQMENELKNLSNNVMLSLYSNFEMTRKEAINRLSLRLQRLASTDKTIVSYKDLQTRTDMIREKIDREKNPSKRQLLADNFKTQMNDIQNKYIQELIRWNSYISSVLNEEF